MTQQRSPERRPLNADGVESSPEIHQGDTLKKWGRKKGEEKPVLETKLTVDVQQWLQKENGKAGKMKLTDLKIDKTGEPGQIRSRNHDDFTRKFRDTKRCRHRYRCR